MQGSPAVVLLVVNPRAFFEQRPYRGEFCLRCRGVQRRHAVFIRGIGIGSVCQKSLSELLVIGVSARNNHH